MFIFQYKIGKLTAGAIRVPTPNVSMALLVLNLKRETTKKELNDYIQERSVRGPLMHQIDFSHSTEAVSSDFVGCRAASIVDGPNTLGKYKNRTPYSTKRRFDNYC